MHHENSNLLNEIAKACTMGVDAIEMLLPKTTTSALKTELEKQKGKYEKLHIQAETALEKYHMQPEKEKMTQHAMLWGSIQMNTLVDSSEQHLAEMMINGTTMGIIDMTKKLNELEQPKQEEKQLAEEFIKSSQAYIDMWKQYL